jgi:hypothetical protein
MSSEDDVEHTRDSTEETIGRARLRIVELGDGMGTVRSRALSL